MFKQPED